jgi:hypothetical protein
MSSARDGEAADKRLESAALDMFALGRVRARDERVAAIRAVDAADVRDAFGRMLAAGAAVGIAGGLGRSAVAQVKRALRPSAA